MRYQSPGLILLNGSAASGKSTLARILGDELQLPVKYIGVGESVDDLMPFQPKEFAEALLQQ